MDYTTELERFIGKKIVPMLFRIARSKRRLGLQREAFAFTQAANATLRALADWKRGPRG